MSRSVGGQSFFNISATTANFTLDPGIYGADFVAVWNGGSVTLEKLAADNATWVTALTPWTANGTTLGQIPEGIFRLKVANATGVFVNIRRIPGE